MIKMLRKNAKYFYFLFFIVIITFVFYFGWDITRTKNQEFVAEVAGQKIPAERFWRAYEDAKRLYREVFKEKASEMESGLKERILEELINEEILLYIAEKYEIKATERELQETIINDPRFMRNGVFQKEIYFQILKVNRITPAQYEALLKRQITITKILHVIAGANAQNEISKEDFIKSYLRAIMANISVKINKEALS